MALSMRLDKYLSHMGFGTRNDVKKLGLTDTLVTC